MSQKIYEIKKFEDIIFKKRELSNTYYACLEDENGDVLVSIVYGENALSGAQHGLGFGNEKNDCGCDNCYVISKEDLMKKILDSAKYIYEHDTNVETYYTEFVHTKVITKTITKIKRKGDIE